MQACQSSPPALRSKSPRPQLPTPCKPAEVVHTAPRQIVLVPYSPRKPCTPPEPCALPHSSSTSEIQCVQSETYQPQLPTPTLAEPLHPLPSPNSLSGLLQLGVSRKLQNMECSFLDRLFSAAMHMGKRHEVCTGKGCDQGSSWDEWPGRAIVQSTSPHPSRPHASNCGSINIRDNSPQLSDSQACCMLQPSTVAGKALPSRWGGLHHLTLQPPTLCQGMTKWAAEC